MVKIAAGLFLNAISIYLVSQMLDGFYLANFISALITAFMLSLMNFFIKPVLIILTLPLNIISLGLFTFVINAFILYIVSSIVRGLEISNFHTAILASILITVINTIFNYLTRK